MAKRKPPQPPREYPAEVERVLDGDTIEVTVQTWRRQWLTTHVRLAGIDCPEVPTPEGLAARTFVQSLLPVGAVVTITDRGDDKYGRTLADIRLADGRDLAGVLREHGHVKRLA